MSTFSEGGADATSNFKHWQTWTFGFWETLSFETITPCSIWSKRESDWQNLVTLKKMTWK